MRVALLACLVGLLSPELSAQEVLQLSDGTIVFQGQVLGGVELEMPAEAVAPEKAEKSEVKEEPSPRLDKFKKLKYDRRPSVILKTWSTPPESEEEDEEAKPEDKPEAPEIPEDESEEDREKREEKERKAAEKAAEEAEKKALEKAVEEEMKSFQRGVTLGEWDRLREYLAGLTEEEVKAAYGPLLKNLVTGPPKARGQYANYAETNVFAPRDIYGLATLSGYERETADLASLGNLLKQCTAKGGLIEEVVALFQADIAAEQERLPAYDVARILYAAGFSIEAGDFLPTPEEALEADDREAMNLIARYRVALFNKEDRIEDLETAWTMTQAALATGEVEDDEKKDALTRAVRIAPKLREELGQSWLDESFTSRPERGMEILSVIGSSSSEGLFKLAKAEAQRLEALELQTTAAEALLAAAPERAGEWAATLELLATNWLREAEYSYKNDTSTSLAPRLQRDNYGNFFYYNNRSYSNRNAPDPIETGKLLKIRPSDAWLAFVSQGLRPRYATILAQLYLKVSEEALAFPHIEQLAGTYPDRAEDLVAEFLRVWTNNHDPNSSSRTNNYMFFYGFEERANAIPLTRSKQERNLVELSEWVGRLRQLPVEVDESLIANAFTKIHSTAEVYRLETIEQVFGGIEHLEPKTLATLAQRMRSNLVGVWRDPNVQKDAKTNRRKKDIEREVLRGYEVTAQVLDRALADHPESWPLVLARASLMHDENNYRQEIARSSDFSSKRMEAFGQFAKAAALYREQQEDREVEDETTQVLETWFYATLGACDLNAIDSEMITAEAQLALIDEELASFEGEAAERHVAQFANTLFTRMSNVSPAVKFRYVRAGLELVGNHERAQAARDVYEYYNDLVTEIRLETEFDGSDRVGHDEPFGVFVNLRHTREIEREAGGFAKYLTNQNNQSFGFNYGRPTENYRDKFDEAARELLSEHFEVLSITFNHPDTKSKAEERYGWRVTPYAYLLLKARGPEVDKLPSLRLDLDFLDTTGYAVLPVESPPLPMDASGEQDQRPFADVQLTQTLDERQAGEGKLVLEIQAKAGGLLPELEELVDLDPPGFVVDEVDDQGLSVSRFDEESSETRVETDRTWRITLKAAEGAEALPESFAFAAPRDEATDTEYQRYVDADLESVERVVSLEARYGTKRVPWAWGLALLGLGAVGFVGLRSLRSTSAPEVDQRALEMPDPITPFTVIGLLRRMEGSDRLGDDGRRDLRGELEKLEGHYFRGDDSETPDLSALARTWLGRVPRL